MATYRLAEILKSRSDLSDDEIARMDEDAAWQWIHTHASAPTQPEKSSNDRENA